MKTTVTTKITIDASLETVFEYLSNLKYHYLWSTQIIKFSSKQKLKLGSSYKTTSVILGVTIEANNKVTAFKNCELIQIENNTGTVHYVACFEVKRKQNKTQAICKTTVSTESKAFAFALPVMKRLARRELQTDLQALRLACEHKLDQGDDIL